MPKYIEVLFEEIPLFPKLEDCSANQKQIRNQLPRLSRNTLFMSKSRTAGRRRCIPLYRIPYVRDYGYTSRYTSTDYSRYTSGLA